MQFFRPFGLILITGLIVFHLPLPESFGQAYQANAPTYGTTQPQQQQLLQQQVQQQQLIRQEPARQEPIRIQPLQTPPKSITHNGVPVYQQQHQQGANPVATGTAARTMPPGYGSPYPTGTQPVPAQSATASATTQGGSIFNLPSPPQAPQAQPAAPQAPIASQSATPFAPQYAPPVLMASAPLPHATGAQPTAAPSQPPQQRMHMGRAEPPMRYPVFVLSPQEQQELDAFLVRWEKYSEGIKQYHADFNLWKYDPTVPGVQPGRPFKNPFGSFKFVAPDRFVYYIEGEWINGSRVQRDKDKNPNVMEEKVIIDSTAVYFFDYNAKKVRQANIPPEMARKGIADSPLPLIFGAKAADLKKRFSMKIVTDEQFKDTQVWLEALPLTPEDRQEFSKIEIRLDLKTLRAIGLKKNDINGKAYDTYVFENVKINPGWGLGNALHPAIVKLFNPEIPRGWQLEVTNLVQEMNVQMQPSPQGQPGPAPVQPQPGVTGQRNEIPLYTP